MKKYAIALIALLAITGLVQAQDKPMEVCPNWCGTINANITHVPDYRWFGPEETIVHLSWSTLGFPGTANYMLEIYFWDQDANGYRVKEVVPLGRGSYELPSDLEFNTVDPPLFYIRTIYADSPCPRRTQWGLGSISEVWGTLQPPEADSAWVYDEGTQQMELKRVVTLPHE